MHNYQGFPGVAFIAGRRFQTEYGVHEPGTIVKEAPLFPNLDVLVSAGLLHPYSPGNGYEYLPPHLFTETNLKEEIEAFMQGDPTKRNVDQFPDGEKPEVIKQAEREAEQQQEIYEALRNRQLLRREAATGESQPPAAKKTATKAAVKKAAATDQKDEK